MGNFTFHNILTDVKLSGLTESVLPPLILNMSITASVIILFVLLARLALKKAPKIFSYALWAVVLFRLLCPVSVTTDFSVLGLFDTPAVENTQHTTAVEYIPYDVVHTRDLEVQLPVPPVINDAVNEALPQEHAALGADPLEGNFAIGSFIWLLGIGAMVLYGFLSYFLLRCKLVGAIPLRDNIYLADGIASPFVMGILRPKIYLPSSLSEQEQTYIILHEQHHIRRLDHLIKALAFIALCIHWFNPLVWVAFVLSSKDMEMSCDEAVVKKLGEDIRADYSASLLSLATGRRIIAGTPLAFGEGDTKSRIKNMLNWKKPKAWITVTATAACLVAIAFCAANPLHIQDIRDEIDAHVCERISIQSIAVEGIDNSKLVYITDPSEIEEIENLLKETTFKKTDRAFSEPPDQLAATITLEAGGKTFLSLLMLSAPYGYEYSIYAHISSGDYYVVARDPENLCDHIVSLLHEDGASDNSYGTAEDIAYYLELSAIGREFRDMEQARQIGLLVEYEDLLDDYTLIARETTDGRSAYIVGSYNGSNSEDSPLYGMYGVEVSTGEDEFFQFLYREENSAEVEETLAAQKDPPLSTGYRIEDSWITWSSNSGIVLIQPKDTELSLDVALNRYLYTPNGREYIADAASRGIDMCSRTEPFLYVYRIDQRFGELAERISLTEAEAAAMLAEERVKITAGFGFSATLHMDGETTYYNEREGVPQSVLDLAVERCDYRFGDPSYITDTIREARLDCDWLDAPLYAEEEDLPRLREILKNAEQGYVGACGYGAKLTLTFTGGEKLTVFKGTDDCDTVVFGSYGGYFIGDKENTEFWEMFGLDPATKTRTETDPIGSDARAVIFSNGEIAITAPEVYADLIRMDDLYSDNLYTSIANLYYAPEYVSHEAYIASANGGWMLTVRVTSQDSAEHVVGPGSQLWANTYWTRDKTLVYQEVRPTEADYNCSEANLAEFKAVMDSIQVEYLNLTPFNATSPLPVIQLSDAETAAAANAVLSDLKIGWWTSEPLKACAYESAAFQCLYREVSGNLLTLYGYGRYARWNSSRSLVEDWGTAVIITMNANTLQVTDFWVPGDGAAYESDILESFPASIARIVAEPDSVRYQEVRSQLLEVCRQTMIPTTVLQEQPAPPSETDIHNAIMANNRWTSKTDALYPYRTEAHHIWGVKQNGDRCTVYALVYCTTHEWGNGQQKRIHPEQTGSVEMVFEWDGKWNLASFWMPAEDEDAIVSIRNRFPADIAAIVLGEVDSDILAGLNTQCHETAAQYYATLTNLPPATPFTPADVEFKDQTVDTVEDTMTLQERATWGNASFNDTVYAFLFEKNMPCGSAIVWVEQEIGTPHGTMYRMRIRFPDGTIGNLPMAREGFYQDSVPDTMHFSRLDGKFVYESRFSEELTMNEGETLIHLKGTYRYEVDLTAKTVSLTLLQE